VQNGLPAIRPALSDVAADRRDRVLLLQVGRGLAALGVAISHARLGTSAFVEPIPDWLMTTLAKGFLGVDFFFVLSGFIILNSHFDDETSLGALKSYVFKRLSRIYVPYLPVCAIVISSYLLFPSLSYVNRDWGFLDTRMPAGGRIVVDDYGFFSEGAQLAVDQFVAAAGNRYKFEMPLPFAGHFCILSKVA
jgi:Acyltransferase family